jgi:tetratricopeptide (TPR) repeat protein
LYGPFFRESGAEDEKRGATVVSRASAILSASVLCAVIAGLAAAGVVVLAAPNVLSTQDAWERAVFERGVDPRSIENPLAYTEEMRRAAMEVARGGSTREKLSRLQRHLNGDEGSVFTYEVGTTLTAREAFEERVGNCVSFTNLFIAMARSIGIPVRPALLHRARDPEMDGDLVVFRNHVVAAYGRGTGTLLFDFNLLDDSDILYFTLIDDLWNTGVYLNNLGARELREGRLERAEALLEQAVALAPRFTSTYVNLGVVRRRRGDVEGALAAYAVGLRTNAGDNQIWANVKSLVLDGATRRLRAEGWTEGEIPDTAPGLALRGDLALGRGYRQGAKKMYREAIGLDPTAPEPRIGLARLHILQGRPEAAERELARVLEADPGNEDALSLTRALERVRASGERD